MDIAPAHPLITLTTDFGLQDPYVGQLKGALLKGCPAATLVDLSHAIPAWDLVTAAITISSSYAFFPLATIHLIVVDPGVGGQRAILAAAGDGHFFICPDNGILSLLVADGKIDTVHRVENPLFFPASVSPTFHGRDIMAPVAAALAAALARGTGLAELGAAVAPGSITLADVPAARAAAGRLHGQVLAIDHFGNVRTSIRVGQGHLQTSAFRSLEIAGQRITTLARTYCQVSPGTLLVLVDSSGRLEIAANQARAADILGCLPGDRVIVQLGPA